MSTSADTVQTVLAAALLGFAGAVAGAQTYPVLAPVVRRLQQQRRR